MTPRTDEELKKFAVDLVDGRIFTSSMCHAPHEVGMVFLVVALGAFYKMAEEDIKNIGLIYEYYDRAGPGSVDGMPIFFTAQIMSVDDCKRAQIFLDEYRRVKENFFEPKLTT
jgi:hypothetical protein